ncbi:MAG: hypothetical protein JNM77_08735 [Pseudonocardia sp.]|nr:hypothetical protein [Pseudonocardia sp.]
MSAAAEVRLTWLDGRTTLTGSVRLEVEGLDADEAVDALLAGLATTEGRAYTVVAAEIVETVRRPPAAVRNARPIPARPVQGRQRPAQSGPGSPLPASSPVVDRPAPPEPAR